MSHISKIQTSFKCKEYLLQALKDLGFNPHLAENENALLEIQGVGSVGRGCEIACLFEHKSEYGREYSREFGFALEPDGSYTMVFDPWLLREEFQNLQDRISQIYAYVSTVRQLELQGYFLQNETTENGEIVLTLSKLQF